MLKKRIVPTLLALCLLLSALPFTALAAVPGSQEVDSLEGFLNRLISAGTLYDYNGAKYDYEHLDGAGTGYCGYAKVLGSSIFNMLSGLRLESYGVKASYTQSGKKRVSVQDAQWLCTNILNWPAAAWEDMLAKAAANKGVISPTGLGLTVKNGYISGDEPAGLAMGDTIRITRQRATGSRLEVVCDWSSHGHDPAGPVEDQGSFYAMVEKKTIGGKPYWTLYRGWKLAPGEDPFARPTVGGFRDVFQGDYYADPVQWAVAEGIAYGTTANTFSPATRCSREQVVTFLWRAMGQPKPQSTHCPFTDAAPGTYYYDAVLWAYETGITQGTTATTFGVQESCSRAQVVTFLHRAMGAPQPTGAASPFQDVKPGAYYYNAVLWAQENHIAAGTSATTFGSTASCDRAAIVTFLYRALA